MEVYGVHNIGSFSGLEGKRLWDLEKKIIKESPQWGGLLRKKSHLNFTKVSRIVVVVRSSFFITPSWFQRLSADGERRLE